MGGAVKILERHTVDLLGEVAAEAIRNIRGHVCHDPALDVGKQRREQIQPQRYESDAPDVVEVNRARAAQFRHHSFKEFGGGIAENLGSDNVGGCGCHGKNDHDHDSQAIRAKIFDQFAHRAFEIAGFGDGRTHHGTMSHRAAAHGSALLSGWSLHHDNSSLLSCDKAIS